MMKLRIAATLGIVMISWSPCFIVHWANIAASVWASIFCRPFFTFSSKALRTSTTDFGSFGRASSPIDARSKTATSHIAPSQCGMFAMWLASWPRLNDFSCGFHPRSASGTRSSRRRMRRDTSTSAIVVLTLALSIGANTTLFSLVRAIIDRPLPVRAPDQLVLITLLNPRNAQQLFTYLPTFDRVRSEQHVFESMSLYAGGGILRGEVRGVGFDGGVETATSGFFESLGVRPYLGRFPTASENPPSGHAAPYVVISNRMWPRYLSADPRALAQTIPVEGIPLNVIGIVPPEFHGLYVDGGTDFWVSMDFVRTVAGDPSKPLRSRTIVARLRPGVSTGQARAEISTLLPSVLSETLPSSVGETERRNLLHGRVNVEPFAHGVSTLRKRYGNPLEALTLLASLLLAIGCTNLTSLFLARLQARDREIVTQLALGASRAPVVRQPPLNVLLLSYVTSPAP